MHRLENKRNFLLLLTFYSFIILLSSLLYSDISHASQQKNIDETFFVFDNIDISSQGLKTSQNQNSHRDTAILDGQRQAFYQLAKKILLKEDYIKIKQLENIEPELFVQSFVLKDEVMSPSAYKAKMTVRFNAQKIKAFFDQQNFQYTVIQNKTFLVLPIIIQNDVASLWFEPNPWFDVWQDLEVKSYPVEFILPLKDLSDIDYISVQQALSGDIESLRKIAQKYQVHDVLICIAEVQDQHVYITMNPFGELEKSTMAYFHYNLLNTGQQNPLVKSYETTRETKIEEIFKKAVIKITDHVEESWKKHSFESSIQRELKEIKIHAAIKNLSQWHYLKEIFEKMTELEAFSVISLGRSEAVISLQTFAQKSDLISQFEQNNLYVITEKDNEWHLYFERPQQSSPSQEENVLPGKGELPTTQSESE